MVYLSIALSAFALSFLSMPLTRRLARTFGGFDLPDTNLKTHRAPTPRLGGIAIFLSVIIVLIAARFLTHYPTGTIRNFRYILLGASIIFTLGLLDDTMPGGVPYKWKFLIQFLTAAVLVSASIRIHFLSPSYIAVFFTFLWIVGISNAINLIDILDGLAATQVAVAAAAFLAIGFPSEDIYVNILAAALLGATLGFLPHNFSAKGKIFMGDAGSLSLGYFLAILTLGCSYSSRNPYAVFAPILIVGVPVFETFFLMYIRLKQGLSPFRGSHDHIAHRLQTLGLTDRKILAAMGAATLALSLAAFYITRIDNEHFALVVYCALLLCLLVIARGLTKVDVNKIGANCKPKP
ncbi:MAG: undecaprenyl/decaprenyl-phosphate alpha-N-acetylglucosaminyl 1-phosphate transferase [Elusimicrobia bacterium]|nr:undecaprenyl/decaprenyl-phosphate alpha-N-acetylglucosaminyl 1-phosphate transferase [Elusimicrobiota bacterium]